MQQQGFNHILKRRISPVNHLLNPLIDHDVHRTLPKTKLSPLKRVGFISALVASSVTLAFWITLTALYHLHYTNTSHEHLYHPSTVLSYPQLLFGLNQCDMHISPLDQKVFAKNRINQRDASNGQPIMIRNATLWDGLGNVTLYTDVLLVNGLIHAIGPNLGLDKLSDHLYQNMLEIDANGRVVTPGIVDMHSHAGLGSFPSLTGTDDVNEMGHSNLPMMRSIDAFNPHDKALPLILSGGITSILVLPGSANLQGGEAFAFKTPKMKSNLVHDMLMFTNLSSTNPLDAYKTGGPIWRYAKQACGENPKRNGQEDKRQPFTRMGNAFLLRENYHKATALRDAQDTWCQVAKQLKGHQARVHPMGKYPTDIHLEQVVALLRGQVKLNWHCYESYDLETQIHIANEFNITIASFHHALDTYMIPDLLKQQTPPIGAAVFADNFWYKKEAYQGSVKTAQVLEHAGIPFAFKSDHPVSHSQFLVYDASKAIHYGLSEQSTLKALTSVPATLLGLDYRIGSLEVGKDADLVIWPRLGPFVVGALPEKVIVDGKVVFEKDLGLNHTPPIQAQVTKVPERVEVSRTTTTDIVFKNIGKIVTGTKTVQGPTEIHLRNGKIQCAGEKCKQTTTKIQPNTLVLDLLGGTVTPSLVLAGTVLGMSEISQEPNTQAGVASAGGAYPMTHARDGVRAGGLIEQAIANQGVGLAISIAGTAKGSPNLETSTLLVTNHTVPKIVQSLNNPSMGVASVHTWIGNQVKENGGLSASLPGQIASLEKWMTEQLSGQVVKFGEGPNNDDYKVALSVRSGEMPLVVHTHSANDISAVLNMKRRVDLNNQIRLVIAGGSESHLVLDELVSFNGTVGVLLSPAICVPSKWATRRCLIPPKTYRNATHVAQLLKQYKIPFALSTGETNLATARNLRWGAGFVRRLADLSEQEMVNSITSAPMQLLLPKSYLNSINNSLDSQLQVDGVAHFNVWNGDFGELETQLLFAVDGSSDKIINYPVYN